MEERYKIITNWSLKPVDILFSKGHWLKCRGKCPMCEEAVQPELFDDITEWEEYAVSGMCHVCQRETFGTQNYKGYK